MRVLAPRIGAPRSSVCSGAGGSGGLAAQRRRRKVGSQVWLLPKRMAISKVRATCAAPPMSEVQAFPRSAFGQPACVPATWSAEFGDRGAQLIHGRAHQFAQFLLVVRCDPCGVRLLEGEHRSEE